MHLQLIRNGSQLLSCLGRLADSSHSLDLVLCPRFSLSSCVVQKHCDGPIPHLKNPAICLKTFIVSKLMLDSIRPEGILHDRRII